MDRHPSLEGPQFEKGLAIRSAVPGEAHVARSLRDATDTTAPLQKLVTAWCRARCGAAPVWTAAAAA